MNYQNECYLIYFIWKFREFKLDIVLKSKYLFYVSYKVFGYARTTLKEHNHDTEKY